MNLGKKPKPKIPSCKHKRSSKSLTKRFEIRYVWDLGYHPHLHCPECDVTAKNALPKKHAQKFSGYGIMPEGVRACEICGEWYDAEFSENDKICVDCELDGVCDTCDYDYDDCDQLTDDELNAIIEGDDFGDAMLAQTELHNRCFAPGCEQEKKSPSGDNKDTTLDPKAKD